MPQVQSGCSCTLALTKVQGLIAQLQPPRKSVQDHAPYEKHSWSGLQGKRLATGYEVQMVYVVSRILRVDYRDSMPCSVAG